MKTPEEIRNLLSAYVPMAEFIASLCGNKCEVVLRDYVAETSTILHLVNGSLSDRKVGDVLSGYGLRKIMKGNWRETDSVTNYIVLNESDHRVFRSSVYYIKHEGQLIGLLCVNHDLTEFLRVRDFYQHEILYGLEDGPNKSKDYFEESLDGILDGILHNVFVTWDRSIPANRVEMEGNPIRQLARLNVFAYKGAVNKVASMMGISPQTLYRYLKDIEHLDHEEAMGETLTPD